MQVELRVLRGVRSGEVFLVPEGGSISFGRTTACQVMLQDPMLSRKHCEVEVSSGRVLLRDMGSSNGTILNNKRLDHRSPDTRGFGYCVFGKVIDGMDVVDKIRDVSTGVKNGMRDVPEQTILIESIKRK